MNAQQSSAFQPRVLGRTGLVVGPIGLSASYGVPTDAVERAFERGANYLYWGSLRRERFGKAIRHLAGQRDRMVLVLQSYMLSPRLITWNVERGLRRLNFGHADVLLLGHVTRDVPEPTLDAWRRLRDRGLVRFLAVSTHQRALVPALADNPDLLELCSGQAITRGEEGVPAFDREKCVYCGACLWNCQADGADAQGNIEFKAGAGGLHSTLN